MKIVSPNDTNHTISLIPRYYPTDAVVFTLYNESTKENTVIDNVYTIDNGVFTIYFDYNFENKDKFQIKIEDNNIVYRGKLLVTNQETQEYKLTKDLYYYE